MNRKILLYDELAYNRYNYYIYASITLYNKINLKLYPVYAKEKMIIGKLVITKIILGYTYDIRPLNLE